MTQKLFEKESEDLIDGCKKLREAFEEKVNNENALVGVLCLEKCGMVPQSIKSIQSLTEEQIKTSIRRVFVLPEEKRITKIAQATLTFFQQLIPT